MTIKKLSELEGYIWLNGEVIEAQKANVHIFTHSLHYSGAVFEGERAYNGKIFKLQEHTERLLKSAKTLYMDSPFSAEEIMEAHRLVIKENNIIEGYGRPLVFRGAESLNMTNKNLSINVLIAIIPNSSKPLIDKIELHVSRWRKPHPEAMPTQCKSSGHYNMIIIAQEEAKALGYDDALLLDWRGYVAECTTTNIFFVKGDRIFTPIADAFLNGITRQTIIELAGKLGLQVNEKYIELSELEHYDECFMTGTAAEIKAVNSIDLGSQKITFPKNRITELLQQEYADLVRR